MKMKKREKEYCDKTYAIADVPIENVVGNNSNELRIKYFLSSQDVILEKIKDVIKLTSEICSIELSDEFDGLKKDLLNNIAEKSSSVICSILSNQRLHGTIRRKIPLARIIKDALDSKRAIPIDIDTLKRNEKNVGEYKNESELAFNLLDVEKIREVIDRHSIKIPAKKRSLASKKGWETRRKNKKSKR